MLLILGIVTSANEESVETYNKIIEVCKQFSDKISSPLDTMQFKGSNEEKYKWAMDRVRQSELIIAEMSTPYC